jgi:uncharacterized protein (TIGR03437 family)
VIRLLSWLQLLAITCYGQVVINEVLFYPDSSSQDPLKNQQWAEIFNGGTGPVTLAGWTIAGADGSNGATARSLPSVTLPGGAYLVVHFTSGQNQLDFSKGSGDFYTGDSGSYWSIDADAVALYGPSGIVDFLNWKRGTATYAAGASEKDAVAANIWTSGAVLLHDQIGAERLEVVRYVKPGDSIGRDADATDTNSIQDFDAGGGSSGLGPTPGRQNLTLAPINPLSSAAQPAAVSQALPAPQRKWTILLFMSGDNDLQGAILDNIQRIQQAGGSNSDVNFVAMYDAWTIAPSTYRGLIGSAQSPGFDGRIPVYFNPPENSNIGEQDMGDPQVLKAFIAWGKQNYPADKYGLVLSSHGDGWKSFGPDFTFPGGTRQKEDALFMGELSTALTGQTFEWIAFEACLMAGIEVAHQLQPFAKYMLASEEVLYGGDFPYEAMVTDLEANPNMDALQSITDIFNKYVPRAQAREKLLFTDKNGNSVPNLPYTVSVIDLSQIPNVSVNIRAWADLLAPGMSLFLGRDDPTDNVQILTKKQLPIVEKFHDQNFIDLNHFAMLMQKSGIPTCLLSPVQSIIDLTNPANKKAVILESHTGGHPNAHGLHIYFPRRRMVEPNGSTLQGSLAGRTNLFPNFEDQPYDLPYSRTIDGSSPLAHYGLLADQLPLDSRDPETGQDFIQLVWPLPQSPGFKFPNDTGWRKVLDRFYHPAADNRILRGIAPDGTVILPGSSGGGACSNPSDSIGVPVGSTVYFSGVGSSDADQVVDILPTHYFWDKDDRVGCSTCTPQPHTVPPGAPASSAVTNMDADQDISNTKFDQKDSPDTAEFSVPCPTPGSFGVTLTVWDDDDVFSFHNTLPNASYVHPQTSSHKAFVSCTALPPSTDIPSSGTIQLNFTTLTDLYLSAPYVGLTMGMATMSISQMPSGGGTGPQAAAATPSYQIGLTGDRSQLVPASGAFNPVTRSFDITGYSTGPIAGFQNVQCRYTLTFSADYGTVTGTYQVGLGNSLNNEPQPVTYTVNGTVTNKKYPAQTASVITNINTAGAGAAIAQNDWIEIHGSNLVPATTPAAGVIWNSAPEFANGKLPAQLGGVSVTVNGKPAFVYFFCSAATSKVCATDQINVLTPLDNTVGPVQVVVTSGATSSAPFTVNMQTVAPSFLLLNPQGNLVATHLDNTLVGPATLYPGYSTPAKPSEPIVLYAVGFGLPATTLVNGSSSQSGSLASFPVCQVGSQPATVAFSGLIAPGLYQINLNVPAGAASAELSCTYNGKSTPAGDLLTIAGN